MPLSYWSYERILEQPRAQNDYQLMISEVHADAAKLLLSAWLCFVGLARIVSLGHDRDACKRSNVAAESLNLST